MDLNAIFAAAKKIYDLTAHGVTDWAALAVAVADLLKLAADVLPHPHAATMVAAASGPMNLPACCQAVLAHQPNGMAAAADPAGINPLVQQLILAALQALLNKLLGH